MNNAYQNKLNKLRSFRWGIPLVALFIGLLIASFVPKNDSEKEGVTVVVLDAGHGGKDPGNLGTGRYKTTEKTIALIVTKKVGAYIEAAFPDVKVIYTRTDDTFLELRERTEIANKNQADLFVSIHCDAFTKETAKGSGTYVMGPAKTEANLKMAQRENAVMLLEDDYEENYGGFDPNSPEGLIELSLRQNAFLHQSLNFAKNVQDQFRTRVGRVDRGVRQAPYWVISFTTMPSALIELGFLTNKEEENFLQSELGQDYMASAIYRAFKEYKKEIEKVKTTHVVTPGTANESDDKTIIEKDTETPAEKNKDITFKVQLVTSTVEITTDAKNFKGVEQIEEYYGDGLYKYTTGKVDSFEQAKQLQEEMRNKGFKGAFVVAFNKNNERINLAEAIANSSKN